MLAELAGSDEIEIEVVPDEPGSDPRGRSQNNEISIGGQRVVLGALHTEVMVKGDGRRTCYPISSRTLVVICDDIRS